MNTYRAALLELKDELKGNLSQFGKTTDPVAPDRAIGRLTRIQALQSQQMALEMKRRGEARLQLVNRALERIENGSCGHCIQPSAA